MIDGVAGRWADLHANAAPGAGVAVDVGAVRFVGLDGSGDRALVDAESAWLTLPREARNGIDACGGHRGWQLGPQNTRGAGCDTRSLTAHHTGLSQRVDVGRSGSFLAGFLGCPPNGAGRARPHAVTAPRTGGEKLTFGHGPRRALEQAEGKVLMVQSPSGGGTFAGRITEGLKQLSAKERSPAELSVVRHAIHGIGESAVDVRYHRGVYGHKIAIDPPCNLDSEYPAGRRKAWLFWALPALFFLYEFMLRVSPSVVAPQLTQEFHSNAADFGFSMGLYYYAYAPMQLVVGIMLDRWGSRRPLAIAAVLCAAGSAVFALAHSLDMAGAGRLLAGVGSAFAYVGTIYVASVWFPRCRLALIAGVTAALGMAGAVAGEVVLEWIEDMVTWRQSFWGFAVAGLGLGLGIWLVVPKRPVWFEAQSARTRTGDGVFHGLGCVLRNPRTWVLSLVAGLLYLPVGAFAAMWGNWYLEDGLGMASPADADAMLFVGLGVAAPLLGWLADRFERPRLVLQIGIAVALAGTTLMLLLGPGQTWAVIPLLFIQGFGVGSIVVAFPMGMHMNPDHARGAAITFINFFQMLLAGVGLWLIGVILDADAHHGAKVAGEHSFGLGDFRIAFLMLPIGLAVALAGTLLLREGVEQQA